MFICARVYIGVHCTSVCPLNLRLHRSSQRRPAHLLLLLSTRNPSNVQVYHSHPSLPTAIHHSQINRNTANHFPSTAAAVHSCTDVACSSRLPDTRASSSAGRCAPPASSSGSASQVPSVTGARWRGPRIRSHSPPRRRCSGRSCPGWIWTGRSDRHCAPVSGMCPWASPPASAPPPPGCSSPGTTWSRRGAAALRCGTTR